jgi:tetratricopeptide (TPR) repeat protein
MKFSLRLFLLILLASSTEVVLAQTYAGELNAGVQAYKESHYADAMDHFRRATELDPSKTVAHLYLATTYVSQYIPAVNTKENRAFADGAIEQYQMILNSDANTDQKINSTKGIAYLYLNMKEWDFAKQYYQKASSLDGNDPEPYYSIGVIDWTRCYQPRMEARARLNISPGENLDVTKPEQKRICDELRVKNQSAIEEGMDNLNKAIQLRPDYDDAMAYMNLLYREKADLECDNPAARRDDLTAADHWVDLTLAVKKAKAQKNNPKANPTAPNPQ